MSLHLAFDDEHLDPFDWGDEPPSSRWKEADADIAAGERRRRDISDYKRSKRPKRSDLESMTRKLLREKGYTYDKAEHFGFTGNRSDLFGFVDGIAVKQGEVLFVQTCTRDSRAAHVRKMATGEYRIGGGTPTPCFEASKALVSTPGVRLVVVMWDQPGGVGTKWRHEIHEVTFAELMEFRARARKVLA